MERQNERCIRIIYTISINKLNREIIIFSSVYKKQLKSVSSIRKKFNKCSFKFFIGHLYLMCLFQIFIFLLYNLGMTF